MKKRNWYFRMMQKLLGIVLAASMIVCLYQPVNVYAITQSDVEAKLSSLIKQYQGTTWNGYYYGSECKGFANLIFQSLFGVYIGAYPDSANYKISNPGANEVGVLSPSVMTQNAATELLKKGAPGDYIQMRRRKNGKPHSMILVNKDAGGITVFDCNSGANRNRVRSYYITWDSFYSSNSAMSLYHARNYENTTANNPVGAYDTAEGGINSVTVSGWAFDKDDISRGLDIHVYVGGPAGSGAPCYLLSANKERKDVGNAYGVGNYHGFYGTVRTDRTGTQGIYLYAINVGGGTNTFLGSKTVNISKGNVPTGTFDTLRGDTESINISGWAFDRDNVSKALDIHVYIGGPAGSGAPCYIVRADKERRDVGNSYSGVGNYHGYNADIKTNKTGKQKVYVYAIDIESGLGNPLLGCKETTIKKKSETVPVQSVSVNKSNQMINKLNTRIQLSAKVSPDNAINKKIIWSSSDSSVATVDGNGIVTAKKNGTALIRATAQDGKAYDECLVKVGSGQIIYGDIDYNGTLTSTDLLIMRRFANGTVKPTKEEVVVCDLDGDSKVTEKDVELLKQMIVGMISSFPVEHLVSSIKITRLPDKLSYYIGDQLKIDGMEVTAVYGNGTSKIVRNYKVSGNLGSAGKKAITVSYNESGVTKTASYHVQVERIALEKIAVWQKPTKTEYIEGENFDPTGMVVKAYYTNGTSKIVDGYKIEQGDKLAKEQTRINISYTEDGKDIARAYQEIRVKGLCDVYGHVWDEYQSGQNGVHAKICGQCGARENEKCEWTIIEVEANCAEDGYVEHFCSICGSSYIDEMSGKFSHTVVTDAAVPATCVAAGKTQGSHCAVCETVLVPQREIPAAGHDWDAGEITIQPTELGAGRKTFTCLSCGAIRYENIPAIEEESEDLDQETDEDEVPDAPEEDTEEWDVPKQGQIVQDAGKNASYKVISGSGKEICVEFIQLKGTGTSTVKVPDTIEMENGTVCKVTAISANAFKNNKKIKKVVIGRNVRTIGSRAFYGCKGLVSVTIGKNVETIGKDAFRGCASLKKLEIPSKVSKIGSNAFYGCKRLEKLVIKSKKLSAKGVSKNTFKGIPGKTIIKVPKNKINSYKKLFVQRGLNKKVKIVKL